MHVIKTTYYQLISLALANLRVANSKPLQPRPYPRLRAKGHYEAAQLLRDNAVKSGLITDSELPDASFRDLLCSVGLLDEEPDPTHSSPFAAHRHHLLHCWAASPFTEEDTWAIKRAVDSGNYGEARRIVESNGLAWLDGDEPPSWLKDASA